MKQILFLLSVLLSSYSFCQTTKFLYYFKADFTTGEKSNAVYTGIGTAENGRLKLECYNNATQRMVMLAWFTDSTLRINDGLFQGYYMNGYKEKEGEYDHGKENGLWEKWDSLGYLIDSSVYQNGKVIIHTTFDYHENGNLSNYYFSNINIDSTANTSYDDKGNITREEIRVKDAAYTKDYSGGKVTMTKMEISDVGKKMEEKNDSLKNVLLKNTPEFPGGEEGFNTFIDRKLITSADFAPNLKKFNSIRFSFMLDKTGHLYDLKIIEYTSDDVDKIFRIILQNMPAWKMKGLKSYGPIIKSYKIH